MLCCVVLFCVVSSSLLCSLSSHVRCVFKSSLGNSVLGGSSHFFSGLCCCFRVRCSCFVAVLLLFICLLVCVHLYVRVVCLKYPLSVYDADVYNDDGDNKEDCGEVIVTVMVVMV